MKKQELRQEKQYLCQVLELLKKQISENETKLSSFDKDIVALKKYIWENRADLDVAEMVSLSNESLTKRNAGQLIYQNNLLAKKMLTSPYFGRVDFLGEEQLEKDQVYLGLSTLMTDNFEFYVYDWRAPIASLFYDYELGAAKYETPKGLVKGKIDLKRQYKIEDGELKYAFDNAININDDILQEVLGQGATAKMKNIVSTIQKEQNKVIRNVEHDCLIVEGPAGSGKTSVALHRLAFLLYKYRDKLRADEILIFSPSDVFSNYIADVLPTLGEQNVLFTSFHDYLQSDVDEYLKVETYMDFIERLYTINKPTLKAMIGIKMSDDYLQLIDNYIERLTKQVDFNHILIERQLVVNKEKLRYNYDVGYQMLPPYQRLEKLIEYSFMKFRHTTDKPYRKKEIMALIAAQFTYERDFKAIYKGLYDDETFQAELKALKPGFVVADFIDYSRAQVEQQELSYEDAIIFAYIKGKLLGFNEDKRIKQVVVDEGQDYTKLQYIMMKNIFTNAQFTILGDVNQVVNPVFAYQDFSEILPIFEGKKTAQIKLTTAYRNTYEITAFANKILALNHINAINRRGEEPQIIERLTTKDALKSISNSLKQDFNDDYKSMAVITKNNEDAMKIMTMLSRLKIPYASHLDESHGEMRLLILPIYYAKGLEFDNVIIYDSAYDPLTTTEKKLFYVACTRALHKLKIISENAMSDNIVKGGVTNEKVLRKANNQSY